MIIGEKVYTHNTLYFPSDMAGREGIIVDIDNRDPEQSFLIRVEKARGGHGDYRNQWWCGRENFDLEFVEEAG